MNSRILQRKLFLKLDETNHDSFAGKVTISLWDEHLMAFFKQNNCIALSQRDTNGLTGLTAMKEEFRGNKL